LPCARHLEARSRRWCASIRTAYTGDVFGSTACDCSELVSRSLAAIAKERPGVFLYLHNTDAASARDREEPCALPQIHFHKPGQLDREPARQAAWSSTKAASARKS